MKFLALPSLSLRRLLWALLCCLTWGAAPHTMQAQAMPSLVLKNIQGHEVLTDTLVGRGRGPVVVSFFATWCKPCLRELRALHEALPEWQAETGVRLVAVSIDEAHNVQKVKPLADKEGWRFPVLLDPAAELKRLLGIQLIPHVLLFNAQGQLVYRHSGYAEGNEEELYDKIRQLSR